MKTIYLKNKGVSALVDNEDYARCAALSWYAEKHRNTWYARARNKDARRLVYMHIFIMGRAWIDHRNRNGLDNQKSNLRPCTQSQNSANSMSRKSVSGYRGVHRTRHGNWQARLTLNYREIFLGTYAKKEDAAAAYDRASIAAFGEFAVPNFGQS